MRGGVRSDASRFSGFGFGDDGENGEDVPERLHRLFAESAVTISPEASVPF